MQGETGQSDERGLSSLETGGFEDSDFGDELVRAVARGPLPLRTPVGGERLGGKDGRRFEVLQELGGGAMGRVFRAWDEELQRVVALKFLIPRMGQEGEPPPAALLRHEARAIAQLNHENIVRVFDVSEWSGERWEPRIPFFVMEYLEGESLAALLQREGRLDVRRALEVLGGIAAGLAHAHEHQVIHRDLKPSNVLLTPQGTVKLLDFGLAWQRASGPPAPHLPTAGTPPYMAPEQWRGERQDERTDIWAAGAMLYEMLTGTLPYPSDTLEELGAKVLSAEPVPSVRERRPELPWEVEHLLATALAKDPARRFRTAQELGEELRELAERFGAPEEAARAPTPERRQVTLVSCRLVGLAGLAEALDAEDLGELEEAFHQHCAERVQRQGGALALSLGDEVLACFGYPVAREEDTEHAVHVGLELAREVPEALQRRLPYLPAGGLAVRVGIHTEQVTLSERSREPRGRALVIQGEAPKVAAWLAERAEPQGVVLSESTWAAVRGRFEAEPLGSSSYQGLAGTVRLGLHRVLRERPATVRFERALAAGILTPLVGRERELRGLGALWEQARGGQGAFVLLHGEAGLGKSRLIQELRERVGHEALVDFQCQCWSHSTTSALYPVIELLQRLHPDVTAPRPPETWPELLGLSLEEVSLLAQLLSLPLPEGWPPPELSPERRKERTFEALTTLLLGVARERPVLGVVEDLHWADPSTLELLGHVLERVEGAPLLLVLSARPDFHPPWPERPWRHRLELERLSAERTATLVREVAGGRELPPETVSQLVARTDGIPLFAEELTRMVLEGGTAGAIPITLHELLLARLDRLPRRQKALAQLCAVVGRGASHALLNTLTRRGPTALSRDLEGLVAAGVLHPGPTWGFRHALLQDAAYESLPRGTRRQLHLRVAQALEAHFPRVVETRPELLAHHYTEAGESEQAIHHWTRAGQRASLRSANVEAVSHFRQALALLHRLPEAPGRLQRELQLLIALGTPLAQTQGYHSPEVERTYSRARELFPQVGEALPRLGLSYWGPFAYYFSRRQYHQAHELAGQLVELGQRQKSRELLALGYRMMAADFFIWGDMSAAREHVERALACSDFTLEEHREQAERQWVNPRVMALAFGAVVFSVLGEPDQARRHAWDALALARRLGHPHTTASALMYVALACQLRREAACARECAEKTMALSREHGFRAWQVWATLVRLWALGEQGRPDEALASMSRAMEEWKGVGIRVGLQHHDLGLLADLHLRRGQPGAALEDTTEALAHVRTTSEHFYEAELHRLQGEALRALGREAEARECFQRALQVARAQGAHAFARRALESLEAPGPSLPPEGQL
jgi:class 3 adenylate cyclase/tetratricopeptide (TPR) repeat protein